MKVIIMAAGRGTRISRHIHGKPKCCVEFEGEPLIHRTVRILTEMKIGEIAVVTGYQSGEVQKALGNIQVAKFYNPFFDVTNSIASLWFTRDFLSTPDDVLLLLERGSVLMAKEKYDKSATNLKAADDQLEILDISDDTAGNIG